MAGIDIRLLRTRERHMWQKMPPWRRKMCGIMHADTNYSMFVAGILSGIPATFFLNLVTMQLGALSHPVLYSLIYAGTAVASVVLCVAIFRFSVVHMEIQRTAKAKASQIAHGQEFGDEEILNQLVRVFAQDEYKVRLRSILRQFIISLVLMSVGIFALCVLLNVNF